MSAFDHIDPEIQKKVESFKAKLRWCQSMADAARTDRERSGWLDNVEAVTLNIEMLGGKVEPKDIYPVDIRHDGLKRIRARFHPDSWDRFEDIPYGTWFATLIGGERSVAFWLKELSGARWHSAIGNPGGVWRDEYFSEYATFVEIDPGKDISAVRPPRTAEIYRRADSEALAMTLDIRDCVNRVEVFKSRMTGVWYVECHSSTQQFGSWQAAINYAHFLTRSIT